MSEAEQHPGTGGCATERAALEQHWIADAMPQLVWTCRPDGWCEFLSRRWVEYTGVPEGAHLGFGWLDRVHPEDRDRTVDAWRDAVAGGRIFDVELRIQRHDGAYRWFRALAQPMRDDAGRIVKWVGSSTDVDDGKRAEQERERLLAEAQRFATELEAIFVAHADGLVIYGPDGEVRSMNPAARELYGIRDGVGRDFREIVNRTRPLDERGQSVAPNDLPSRRALRGERVEGVVLQLHTDRGPVWYSLSAVPLRAADGAIVGAVLSYVDITHVRRLLDEREQMIRALTHDARTRLNVIQTHGEMLGRANVVERDVRRRGEIIVSSARRLADTINALVGGR